MRAEKLFEDYNIWAKDNIVKLRVDNEENGYSWCFNALGWPKDKAVGLKECQNFFDRTKLNAEYEARYKVTEAAARKPYAWYQNEINLIYSFHKCFATRYHSRLQFYRHDLSQKGIRNFSTIRLGVIKFLYKSELAELA